MTYQRVVLIGMSGAGKSTVGAVLADRLGWRLLDLDAEIERREGRTIPEIFSTHGEAHFRDIERTVILESLRCDGVIIATGGGAVVNDDVWSDEGLRADGTLTVLLDAPAEVLYQRLVQQQASDPSGAVRPMLEGADPLGRLQALKHSREPWYQRADAILPVRDWPVDRTVGWITSVVDDSSRVIDLDLPGATSRIHVADGAIDRLAERIEEQWPSCRRVWTIADDVVAGFHQQAVAASAGTRGLEVNSLTFPAGEGSKSLTGLSGLYDALLNGGIERRDVLVALGGGVAGDLVGFAAATTLRGVGLVQVPTSLLAMVDSSVGGKTGINHVTGKNLIGAFYQPPVVLIDPRLLSTLPEREYRSGWAEIIKHGVIEPSTPAGASGLLELIEANVDSLKDRTSPLLGAVIARNVEIKASVVRADERESGLRAILNFGHTIGHAVEAAGYRLLHGEAVAAGLHGAMRIGLGLERVSALEVDRVADLLESFGLPTHVHADTAALRRLMQSDKKRVDGQQQWIVPAGDGGGVTIERGVSEAVVEAAIAAVVGGSKGS